MAFRPLLAARCSLPDEHACSPVVEGTQRGASPRARRLASNKRRYQEALRPERKPEPAVQPRASPVEQAVPAPSCLAAALGLEDPDALLTAAERVELLKRRAEAGANAGNLASDAANALLRIATTLTKQQQADLAWSLKVLRHPGAGAAQAAMEVPFEVWPLALEDLHLSVGAVLQVRVPTSSCSHSLVSLRHRDVWRL